jgi:hypothetical protein
LRRFQLVLEGVVPIDLRREPEIQAVIALVDVEELLT